MVRRHSVVSAVDRVAAAVSVRTVGAPARPHAQRTSVPAVSAPLGSGTEIYAVRYGTLRNFPVAALVAAADTTRRMDLALMGWLIRMPEAAGHPRPVLVDAGFYRDTFVR